MPIITQYRIVSITSADCASLLNKMTQQFPLKNIRHIDPFVVEACCPNEKLPQLQALADKMGAEVTILTGNPVMNVCRQLLFRPILLLLVMLLLVGSIYLPKRILFIRVEGNHFVPTKQILEIAENCGIGFGAARNFVRSEQVKNNLLEQIPQLQWIGVNTAGCTASIQVREKSKSEEQPSQDTAVGSIVAAQDGIILQCDVTKGTALCRPGQAVREGQVLISGYTDNGLTVSAARATGEVQALTNRSLRMISPFPAVIRGDIAAKEHYYSIRLGKKLINLQKDSGISGSSCAKIYTEDYACLPGGFQLPVSLIRTTVIRYDTQQVSQLTDTDAPWITSAAQDYLRTQMIGGEILSSDDSVQYLSDSVLLQGSYTCREMIGRIKYEESMYQHGEND